MKLEIHIDCSDGLTFKRPSLVKPQFADECDLGKIVARFVRTGELPNLAVKKPLNIDATAIPDDFQALQDLKVNLSNAFENESDSIKEACQHNLEIYAEFKSFEPLDQVKFLQSKGFSKESIISLLKRPELFETQPAAQPAVQQAAQPAVQQAAQQAAQD